MPDFGTIVLVAFPFTDLTASKVRPALVLSRKPSPQGDVIVCFITSRSPRGRRSIALKATAETGLKVPSFARLDKIATLEHTVLLGELGRVAKSALRTHRGRFFSIFGF